MSRMQALLAIALLAVSPLESEAAFQDRVRFDPITQQGLVYLSLSDVPEKDQEQLAKVVAFVVPSLCHKPNIVSQLPVRVEGTPLLRIDLEELGWQNHYQAAVIKHHPYRPDLSAQGKFPLVISALWFVAQATDPVETGDTYYQLLYSGKPPKNLKEFHAFWTVQSKQSDFIGFVEGRSQVAVQKHRLIENHPTGNRGSSWSTYDSAKLEAIKDPLENLIPGQIKFDVGEHFAFIPKRSINGSGGLIAPFLTNSKGERQEAAPVSIVVDKMETRTSEIRNFISCVACHASGINPPTLNEYAEYLISGANIYSKDRATKEAIETYLQSDFMKEVVRANEDWETGLRMCNEMRPADNAVAYVKFVRYYDAEVDLPQAARELGCDEKTLSLALAYYSASKQPLPARLAGLAHDVPMPRDRWEQEFYPALLLLQNYQKGP